MNTFNLSHFLNYVKTKFVGNSPVTPSLNRTILWTVNNQTMVIEYADQ